MHRICKAILYTVAMLLARQAAAIGPFDAWTYRCDISFPGYTSASPLTNFPVLVTFANGVHGFQYSQLASPSDAADLRFADTNGVVLAYQLENWGTGGQSFAWVRVPRLTSNTVIKAYWGMAGQSVPAYTTDGTTWSEKFLAVWHLNETSGVHADATGAGHAASPSGTVNQAVSGLIDGADQFGGADGALVVAPAASAGTEGTFYSTFTNRTFSLFFQHATGSPTTNEFLVEEGGSTWGMGARIQRATAGGMRTTRSALVCADDFETFGGWTTQGSGVLSQLVDATAPSGTHVATKTTYGDPNGAYKDLGVTLTDFEMVVYSKSVGSRTSKANRYSLVDASGNGYGCNLGDTTMAVEKRTAWTGANIGTTVSEGWVTSLWSTYRFIKIGSTLTFEYYEGVLVDPDGFGKVVPTTTVSRTDASWSSFRYVAILGGFEYYSDDLRVWNISAASTGSSIIPVQAVVRPNAATVFAGGGVAPNTSWHQAVAVQDGQRQILSLYADGALMARATGTATINRHTSGTAIGNMDAGNGSPFPDASNGLNGRLDEVRAAGVARSADWVRAEWLTAASNATFTAYGTATSQAGAPIIFNSVATNIGATGADLVADLTQGGAPVTVWCYWGRTNEGETAAWQYKTNLDEQAVGWVTNHLAAGVLSPATRYSFNFFASNTVGTAWGSPAKSFSTLGGPRVIETAASDLTPSSAALNGEVLGGNPMPHAWIYWGTSNGGMSKADWDGGPPVDVGVPSDWAFSGGVSGLMANKTYWYRCAASNAYASEVWAASSTNFTTLTPVLSADDVTVTEGALGSTTNAIFRVGLSTPSATGVSFHYQTSDGTATAGSDYTAASGNITMPPGMVSTTVVVQVLGDNVGLEGNETFSLDISALVNASGGDSATGTIVDDDFAGYQWNTDGGGAWNTATNWLPAVVPNNTGNSVLFGSVITAPRTVTLAAQYSVNRLVFDSTNSYTLSGNSVKVSSTATTGIQVFHGEHTVAALATDGNGGLYFNASAGTKLTVTGDCTAPQMSGRGFIGKSGTGEVHILGKTYTSGWFDSTISGGVMGMEGGLMYRNSYVAQSNRKVTVNAGATWRIGGTLGTDGAVTNSPQLDLNGNLDPVGTVNWNGGDFDLRDAQSLAFELGSNPDKILLHMDSSASPHRFWGPSSAGQTQLILTAGPGFQAGTYDLIDWSGALAPITVTGLSLSDFTTTSPGGRPGTLKFDNGVATANAGTTKLQYVVPAVGSLIIFR